MPLYEYEPIDWDCAICAGRVGAIQSIHDEPLSSCPTCGLPVRRIVSQVAFNISKRGQMSRSGEKGFSTYEKVDRGVWEKTSGDNVDLIVRDTDSAPAEAEKPARKLDLNKPE